MPDLQSIQTSVLRAGGYSFAGYLAAVPKRILFSRAVNMPGGITEPLLQITFDNPYSGAGAYTDVPSDAEIVVYVGNTNVIRGRLRVAYGQATATVIQVNEVSAGRIQIADNDRFEVLDEFRLRDKLVSNTAQFNKDSRFVYSNQGLQPAPVIVVGGAAMGFVNPATGLLTVTVDASRSYPTDPDNTGGLDYLYDVADGSITVGSTTTAAITVTFNANTRSHRHITLIVSDHDTGVISIRKIPVFSFDGVNTLPIPVKKVTRTGTKANGHGATFEMYSNCDIDSLPEGCAVYYFEREYFNGVEISYGNLVTGRSNVKFVGYLRRETITIDPQTDTLTFEAISPLQKLAELTGFSQRLKTAASPATWQEDEQVTLHKLFWYIIHYHSTWSVNYDLIFDIADYDYPDISLQASTLLGQMQELAKAISATFTCDWTGQFLVSRNLQRATTAERTAALTTLAMTLRDVAEIPSLVYEHSYQTALLVGKAFSTAGLPVIAVAPGEAPAEAPAISSEERLIVADQTELDYITERIWEELNSVYAGLGVPKGMTLKVPTSYDVVDPAYAEWLTLTLAASTNRRGRFFSGDRFILQRVEIDADSLTGIKAITWTVDHETYSTAVGTLREVPAENPLPVYTPPALIPVPYVNTGTYNPIPDYTGTDQEPTRLIIYDSGAAKCHIATAWSPSQTVISWADRSTGLAGVNHWATADPFHYSRYFVLQSTGIYRSNDPFGGSSHSLVGNNAALFGNSSRVGKTIVPTINLAGYFAVLCGTHYFYTFDYWATVHDVDILGGAGSYQTVLIDSYSLIAISPYNSASIGWVYAFIDTVGWYKSTDWGATWTQLIAYTTSGINAFIGTIHIPYIRVDGVTPNINDSSQEVYTARDLGNEYGILLSQDAGASWSFTRHVNAGGQYFDPSTTATGHNLMTFTWDGAKLSIAGSDNAGDNQFGTAVSNDQGATYDSAPVLWGAYGGRNHVNRWPLHSKFSLFWSRDLPSLRSTVDDGANYISAAAPAGYTGVSYVEGNLGLVVPAIG